MEKNTSYIDWTHKFRDGVSEIQWDAQNVNIFMYITGFTDATPVSHSVRQHFNHRHSRNEELFNQLYSIKTGYLDLHKTPYCNIMNAK